MLSYYNLMLPREKQKIEKIVSYCNYKGAEGSDYPILSLLTSFVASSVEGLVEGQAFGHIFAIINNLFIT